MLSGISLHFIPVCPLLFVLMMLINLGLETNLMVVLTLEAGVSKVGRILLLSMIYQSDFGLLQQYCLFDA